jgi:hypothetical protein
MRGTASGGRTVPRVEKLRDLRRMFEARARAELLAAMALAAMGEIQWQDALNLYQDAMQDAVEFVTDELTAGEKRK